jgi:transglutaminase-like putative cysteine protease
LSQPYSDEERISLKPALARDAVQPEHDLVQHLAVDLVDQTDGQIFDFLQLLNQTLHERVELCHREEGDPYAPVETLNEGRAACRDLAVLFADACRSVGLAARFTSGYHLGSDREDEHDLHAWTEVYIPNAGWRGFDPSSGLLAAECHIPVASSVHYSGSAPIVGSYRSSTATNSLETRVQVSAYE